MDDSPVLVVGPSWVGDMVMAQSLFRLLRQRRPAAEIDVLAPAWSLPVISRMPEIRDGVVMPAGHGEVGWGKRRRLGKALAAKGYGQAIVLPRSLKSALLPWFAGIPRRTGFRGEWRYGLINDMRPFDRDLLDQTVKRFLALGLERGEALPAPPAPRLSVLPDRQAAAIDRLGLDRGRPAIAMMPGAEYGPAKCWPVQYFAALAAMLDEAGHDVWVFGSEKDRASGSAIAAAGHAVDLCGRTSLEDVIDLLGACRQAVSNDSGLMHVAAAVGLRVVALYGSTSPDFTPPLTASRVLHYLALDCSPCFARECPLGHLRCLKDITPEAVYESLELP